MRSNYTVETIKRHTEYEESTAQRGRPQRRRSNSAVPLLVWREIHIMYCVQI